MSAESAQTTPERSEPVTTEHRLKELGITLPAPPEPFGAYAEAVQTAPWGLSSQKLTAAVSNFGGLGSFGTHSLAPHAINDSDRADPLPHLEVIRHQSVGLDRGRQCPDIG